MNEKRIGIICVTLGGIFLAAELFSFWVITGSGVGLFGELFPVPFVIGSCILIGYGISRFFSGSSPFGPGRIAVIITIALIIVLAPVMIFIAHFDQGSAVQDNSYLLQSGTKVSATITDVQEDTSTAVNYQYAQVIVAQWTNASGTVYTFKSDPIWRSDVSFLLRNKDSISVYIDPNNPAAYFMDLSSVGIVP